MLFFKYVNGFIEGMLMAEMSYSCEIVLALYMLTIKPRRITWHQANSEVKKWLCGRICDRFLKRQRNSIIISIVSNVQLLFCLAVGDKNWSFDRFGTTY